MKYSKPEVATLGFAVKAIQSDQVKPFQLVEDNPILQTEGTSAAYEADE